MYYVYRCPVVDEGWSHLKTLNQTVIELLKTRAKNDNKDEHNNRYDLLMARGLLNLLCSIPDDFLESLAEEPHVIWTPEVQYSNGLKPSLLLKSHSKEQWFITQLRIDCSNFEWELIHEIDIATW